MQLYTIKPNFQTIIGHKNTDLFTLENVLGTQVGICNYGARITHFMVKDAKGNTIDIVLGFNSVDEYQNSKERYHGVTVGPFANRIAGGCFSLNNKQYHLEANNGTNCLHGGSTGFHDKVWDLTAQTTSSVSLTTITKENEGGFPGELSVTITYSLNDDNELLIEYSADSKQDTFINLTNHAYFNLNGAGDILSHQIKIEADQFLPINESCIPLGSLKEVLNTPFDFRIFKAIDSAIDAEDEQLKIGKGYDHSFELQKNGPNEFTLAATAIGDVSGIKLEVLTTEPAVQFYTGNYLGGQDLGKNNELYEDRTGFCFETQHHPDSPNQPGFKSTLLKSGEKYYSKTVYKVSI